MKRAILFLAVITVVAAVSAQDIIVTVNNEKISAKIVEVNISDVKYKKSLNIDGPTYTILKSDIVTIIYENGSVEAFNNESSATGKTDTHNYRTENPYYRSDKASNNPPAPRYGVQRTPNNGDRPEVYVQGKKIYCEGNLLSSYEYANLARQYSPQALAQYVKGKGMTYAGISLFASGLGLVIGGTTWAILSGSNSGSGSYYYDYYYYEDSEVNKASYAIIGLGGAFVVTSIPLWVVGNKKQLRSVDTYNGVGQYYRGGYGYNLNLGISGNGIGLALNF